MITAPTVVLPVPAGPHKGSSRSNSTALELETAQRAVRPYEVVTLSDEASSNVVQRPPGASGEWRDLLQALSDGVVKERRNFYEPFGVMVICAVRESPWVRCPSARLRHEVSARPSLGIRDDFANVFLAREDRHQPVDTEGEAGVGRRAVMLNGAEQEPETALLGLLFGKMPSARKTRDWMSGPVDSRTDPLPSSQPLRTQVVGLERTFQRIGL